MFIYWCVCGMSMLRMYPCGCVHTCVWGCVWRPEVDIRIFLSISPPYFMRQSLSLNLWLTNLAGLAGQWTPGVSLSPPLQLGLQMCTVTPGSWCRFWGSKLRFSGLRSKCFIGRSLPWPSDSGNGLPHCSSVPCLSQSKQLYVQGSSCPSALPCWHCPVW